MADKVFDERLEKIKLMKDLGINAYAYSYAPTHHAAELNEKYSFLQAHEATKDKAVVAGRVVLLRRMGKVTFAHLQDQTGRFQLFFKFDDIGEAQYSLLKLIDLGDIIGANGFIFKTKTGEVTLSVQEFSILSKSLLQLPEKYHGLKDTELRYRQRYLDLIANPEVKEVFLKRAKIIKCMRDYLSSYNFTEVETPTLQPIYGGANAKPFVTFHNSLNMKLYLSISPELYLKRLIVGGFERVYTICKNFRNEGIDRSHNPEFTMMECYSAYWDYNTVMEFTEKMIEQVALNVLGTTKINYQGVDIELKAPWRRLTMIDAIKEFAEVDVNELNDEDLFELRHTYNLEIEDDLSRGKMIQALFENLVEDKLIQPTFITDHPKESTPLCKEKRGNSALVERFEPFINGWEIGNAYSELNDPVVQRNLLKAQAEQLRAGSENAHPMDEDYITSLEYGLPPTGGLGIGVDRIVMLLTNQACIRDVILFPTMKNEEVEALKSDEKKE